MYDTVSSNGDEFYDVPIEAADNGRNKTKNVRPAGGKDQCDSPASSGSPAPSHKKIKGFVQRFLKSTGGANNKAPLATGIIYDDATSSALYDDASAAAPCYDDASKASAKTVEVSVCYDDVSGILLTTPDDEDDDITYDDVSGGPPPTLMDSLPPPPPVEEYEYVDDVNNDSDGVSVKSGASEYGTASSPNRRWHISTSDAISQVRKNKRFMAHLCEISSSPSINQRKFHFKC